MKTNTTHSKIQILVYGIDETGKPKAGRFAATEAEAAKEAATSMKLSFCEVNAPATDGLMKEIPAGRIHAKGKGFVPFVKQSIYDQLLAEVAKLPSRTEATGSSLDQSLARAKADQESQPCPRAGKSSRRVIWSSFAKKREMASTRLSSSSGITRA